MRNALIATTCLFIVASVGYYYIKTPPPPTKTSRTTVPTNQTRQIENARPSIRSSTDASKAATTKLATGERINLPHWREAFRNYEVPKENLADEVDKLRDSIKSDPSGRTEMKLFRIADYCDRAAKNKEQLKYLKSLHEEVSLMSGQTNGETLANINRAVTHYNECKSLESKGLPESYDYLEVAAAKGDAKANTVMATLYKPKGFSDWTQSEKEDYRKKMEKGLKDARKRCEPQAFYAIAHGVGENELWVDSNQAPKNVRLYANLLARGMIYANKSKGAAQYLASRKNELESIASEMTQQAIAVAEMRGRQLYRESCTDQPVP